MKDEVFENLFDMVDEFKAETIQELIEEYEEVQEELFYWLSIFSIDNKLDWTEMRQNLTDSQLRRLQRYIGDNIEDRVRIKRIDTINLILETKLEEINQRYATKLSEFSTKLYEETYYRTNYDVQDEKQSYWIIPTLVVDDIVKKILKPWTADGINFVERIEVKSNQLIDKIRKEITQSILRGESPDSVIKKISKQFNININSAKNLINTESTRVVSEATYDAMKVNDVKEYQLRAVLDHRTSDICISMNGKRFKITEFEIGVTASPFHSHCRTIIIWNSPKEGIKDDLIRSYDEWFERYIRQRSTE